MPPDNQSKILKHLQDYDFKRRKTILASLIVLNGNNDDINDKYRSLMKEDIQKYDEEIDSQQKSDSQRKNWISQNDLFDIRNDLKSEFNSLSKKQKITKRDIHKMMDYVILCLYTMIPPRRLEYIHTKFKNYDKDSDNYYDKKSKVLGFNIYKTFKTYGKQNVKVPKDLMMVLNSWIKVVDKYDSDIEFLLFNSNDNPLSQNQLKNKIQNLTNGASVNILRHSFLSEKFRDIDLNKMKNIAEDMGHDVEMQMRYVKKD
jgi:hypothetical protein